MNDITAELALAQSPAQLHEALVQHLWEQLPTSSIHLMPLVPRADGQQGSVLYHRKDIVDELLAGVAASVQTLQTEPGMLDLFSMPGRVLRVEEALGWDRWLRSRSYNEFFRRSESARQLVLGLLDRQGVPSAFLAVCRAESDDVISREEEAFIVHLRDRAERALAAFDLVEDWAQPADAILLALEQGMPSPALLVSEQRVLWMNEQARLRLGMASVAFRGSQFYLGQSPALAEILAYARAELRQPGSALTAGLRKREGTWLLPGESILVRRIDQGELPPCCLVCLNAPAPPPLRPLSPEQILQAYQLTPREIEITRLAAEGFGAISIASQLNIAESTVCTHLKRVYRKLGVSSRAELAWRMTARAG